MTNALPTPKNHSRPLSPDNVAKLEMALRRMGNRPDAEASELLTAALQSAAREARERSLLPEELLLAFKEIESRIGIAIPDTTLGAGTPLRLQMIRAMLEAYYAG